MSSVIPGNWTILILTFAVYEITSLPVTTDFYSSSFPLKPMTDRHKHATVRRRLHRIVGKILDTISDESKSTEIQGDYIPSHFPQLMN